MLQRALRSPLDMSAYTSLQWQDMAAQRAAWLKKTRPHDAITFVHKCSNVSDLLTKDCEPATKQAILSMVKAPPTTIGMGRPVVQYSGRIKVTEFQH